MMNMRNFFLNNPNMFELFASYESNSEESKLTFEDFLTKMLEYGFSLEDAAYIGRTMRVYVIGQVKFELNTEKNVNEHTSFTVNTSLQLKHSADFFKQIGGYNHDKSFEFGANLIVNGCSKLLTN